MKVSKINETIISQYANSPTMLGVIYGLNELLDNEDLFDKWVDNIMDIEKCKGFALDMWGKIIGISRYVYINPLNQFSSSTFEESIGNYQAYKTYKMNDDSYRQVIILKCFSNICYASFEKINEFLRLFFGNRGNAYMIKNGTMKARYVFNLSLTETERALLVSLDLLPKPCGVLIDFYEPNAKGTFGFNECSPDNPENGFSNFTSPFYIGDRLEKL